MCLGCLVRPTDGSIPKVSVGGRGPGGVTSGWGEGSRREQGANLFVSLC